MSGVSEGATTPTRRRKRMDGWRWAGRIFLALMLFYTAVPMIWMLLTSIKSGFAAMQLPPQWWPEEPTLASYQKLLDPQNSVGADFLRFFWNSLYVSTLTTILGLVVAVPAAYAFSRFTFPGRNFLFFSVLLRNMFPAVIFLIPLFILMRWVGLVNTHGSLIITYLTFVLPLTVWTLRGFIVNLPRDLEEAAMVDGCTRTSAFLRVVFPLLAPGMVATSVYAFIQAWNEYLYALMLMSQQHQTATVWLGNFTTKHGTEYAPMMAGATMMAVPMVVLFLLVQRRMAAGLTAGAVKG